MKKMSVDGETSMDGSKSQTVVIGTRADLAASARAFYQLTKPRVVALLVLTAWVGMMLASEGVPDLALIVTASLGIAMVSGAAAAFNHVLDQKIDARMARTRLRPLPEGRLSSAQALSFAFTLAASGFVLLLVAVNALTAVLTLAGLFGYAVIYTVLLKRATPQNIVIGGVAGALPPVLGWAAVTGTVGAEAWLLMMIIFTWTPPHFWALAIHRVDDYARAGIPMLPVTHGIAFTKTLVLLYTCLLLAVCLLPYLVGMSGVLYLAGSLVLNLQFLRHAWRLKFAARPDTAIRCFRFSITHLMLLFLLLLVDHYSAWLFI